MRGSSAKQESKAVYKVEVTRGHQLSDKVIIFDLKVNDVTIYGMVYREYINKEGKTGEMISFPSQKGKDDNWYSHAWFPISKEVKEDILNQLDNIELK